MSESTMARSLLASASRSMRKAPRELRRMEAALARLAESDSYMKRRNARREFQRAVAELDRLVKDRYPMLRANGQPVESRVEKHYQCPVCRVPVGDIKQLCKHLRTKHKYERCPCRKGGEMGSRMSRRHLSSIPDLGHHFAAHILLNAGRARHGIHTSADEFLTTDGESATDHDSHCHGCEKCRPGWYRRG